MKVASSDRRRTTALAVAVAIITSVAGCGSAGGPPAPPPQPPVVPGQATTGPDLTGVQLPDFVMPLLKGGVARPDRKLTPGAVVTTNANVVCARPAHGMRRPISSAMQTAVYRAYRYTTLTQQHKYILNYLVPWDLGGALVMRNIWPAAVRGAGFYEKIQTDHVLRDLVCRRALPLTQAQRDLETDWYAAWLRYVVATGHA